MLVLGNIQALSKELGVEEGKEFLSLENESLRDEVEILWFNVQILGMS